VAKKESVQPMKTSPVRIERGIALKAKIAAEDMGVDMSDYLSKILKAVVERDWARARKKIMDADA
jgi:hypothetical protein